jgi:transcriptional regulator with XRE-family HTH domain
MSFGAKLKELRQQAGLSQTQLAEASGVPVGTIRDYEQSKRDPLLSSAQKLAAALSQSLDAFAPANNAAAKANRVPKADPPAAKRGRRKKGE